MPATMAAEMETPAAKATVSGTEEIVFSVVVFNMVMYSTYIGKVVAYL